jgi:hypothetical protein
MYAEGAPGHKGGAGVQLEYKTRTVKFNHGKGFDDQYLKDATEPDTAGDNWWEIFAVFPLPGDVEQYRLFMRREKPRR